MKSIVLFLGTVGVALIATSREAQAQRSGSLQATAQVVDTRESWSGLNSASQLAAQWQGPLDAGRTIETAFAHVSTSVDRAARAEDGTAAGTLTITIQYLHN